LRFGDTADDRAQALASDGSGNVAMVGHLDGTSNFGCGSVTSYIHASLGPSVDSAIAVWTPSGTCKFHKVLGHSATEEGKGITFDASGNIIATGYQGSYSVDYGGGAKINQGYTDIWVAKYGTTGTHIWSKTIGGYAYDQGNAVATNSTGDVYVAGYFGQDLYNFGVNFGGGAILSNGGFDAFLAKYSAASGAYISAIKIGGTGNDVATSVSVDASNNIYLAGNFEGTVNFGGGNVASAGGRDIFLVKYNSAGTFQWVKTFGSTGDDALYQATNDGDGDVLIVGKFQGSVNFGGGALTSAGGDDAFLVKLATANGAEVWAKKFGSTSQDIATSVAVGDLNQVAIAGQFSGSVDFGTGALVSAGVDVFVARYDTDGVATASNKYGGADTQIGDGVTFTTGGSVVAAGFFNAGITFGSLLSSAGGFDGFVAAIGQ
jgi:hypothetical protein